MCTEIVVIPDRSIDTVGELAEFVGGASQIVTDEVLLPEYCLCGVDVPETLRRAGYKPVKTPYGYEINPAQ